MVSYKSIAIFALIGSVMLAAVQAQEVPDVTGYASSALNDAQNVAQNAAQGAQGAAKSAAKTASESAQNAGSRIMGIGAKLYNTVKNTGSSILSHIPFVGHSAQNLKNKTVSVETVAAGASEQAEKQKEQVEAVVTEVVETASVATATAAAAVEVPQQQGSAQEGLAQPKKENNAEKQ